MSTVSTDLVVAAPVHNQLGESPVWDDQGECLWWVDILKSKLYRLVPKTAKVIDWTLPRPATALALMGQENALILGCPGALMRFDVQTGQTTELAPFEIDKPNNRPNDGKCDPSGRFWLSSLAEDEKQGQGALYRIDQDLNPVLVIDQLTIPNTLAWSPDQSTFYFADSPEQTIWAFDYDAPSGDLSNRRVFASLKGTEIYPDGSTIDADGYLWNAQWNGWRVVRYAPDGAIDRILEMPVACPTSCMFGAENLDTLFITSARKDQTDEALSKQPHAGALFALNAGVSGLPATPFKQGG